VRKGGQNLGSERHEKNDAIKVLRRHQDDLRARGIIHAALFGSVARGEAGPNSDLDVLIEFDPELNLDIFAYAGLKRYVAELFSGRVDVVNKEALKPHLRQPVSADAVYAF
jgi:predicted nucleotidyltransferase